MSFVQRIDTNSFENLKKLVIYLRGDGNEAYYHAKTPSIGYGFDLNDKNILKIICNEIYESYPPDKNELSGLYETIKGVNPKTNENLAGAIDRYLDTIRLPEAKDGKSKKNDTSASSTQRKFHAFKFNDEGQKQKVFIEILELFRQNLNDNISHSPIEPLRS